MTVVEREMCKQKHEKAYQVRGSVLVVVVVVMVVVKLKAKSGQDSKFISLIFPHQTNKAPNFPHHQKLRS